jgi:hypothetical protein
MVKIPSIICKFTLIGMHAALIYLWFIFGFPEEVILILLF